MPELLSLADVVLAGAGYNTIQELRLHRRPAILFPLERKLDDQRARANALARRGTAIVLDLHARDAATRVAETLLDTPFLERARDAYTRDPFTPGNDLAARTLLRLLEIR